MATIQDTKSLKKRVRKTVSAARRILDRANLAKRAIDGSIAEASIVNATDAIQVAADAYLTAMINYKNTL